MSSSADLAALISAIETADSKAGIVQAVRALAMAQDPGAIPMLIKVLGYNNPGAAVAATDGLVSLGEAAVPALLEQIDGYNYGARAWAIRALSLIQDPRALPVLLEATRGDFALSVRRAAAKGLGTLDWSRLPENEVGSAQSEALTTLLAALQDPEWVVRYSAVVGLQALALAMLQSPTFNQIVAHLQQVAAQDDVLAVQARSQMGLDVLLIARSPGVAG
ncbi:MAG TPA: HEAT repeat domain-containing protein [Leptolyngbyaceae cyanobacterium]